MNGSGQLGLGSTAASYGSGTNDIANLDYIPFSSSLISDGIVDVAPSPNSAHVCALFSSSGVVCWGSNAVGELGIDGGDARGDVGGEMAGLVPVVFADSITNAVVQVATGGSSTCGKERNIELIVSIHSCLDSHLVPIPKF